MRSRIFNVLTQCLYKHITVDKFNWIWGNQFRGKGELFLECCLYYRYHTVYSFHWYDSDCCSSSICKKTGHVKENLCWNINTTDKIKIINLPV